MIQDYLQLILKLDAAVFNYVHKVLYNSVLFFLLNTITDLADIVLLFATLYVIVSLIFEKRRKGSIEWVHIVAPVIITAVINIILKLIFERPPPIRSHVGWSDISPVLLPYAFPSGHSSRAFALAVSSGKKFPKWSYALITSAIVIGFSRVYIGAHFPGDVLAGAVLGAVISLLYYKFITARSKTTHK